MLNATRCVQAALPLVLFVAVCGCGLSAVNRDAAVNKESHFFSLVPTPTSGPEMYSAYCAGCHGKDGRGDGVSSRYCTVPPADLTQLSRDNHAVYPAGKVCRILRQGTGRRAQGTGYMPIWGPLLKRMNADPPGVTEVRIQNFAVYAETLQDKPGGPYRRTITSQ